jgi:3-methyl-2-oxobutanoate hydroxymethyltransferase
MTVPQFAARKGGEKLTMLTAYTTPMARNMDGHVDAILVGDSVGMVVYGMDDTLGVTLDMMVNHGRAVVRGTRQSLVIVDMPFGSYHESPAQAVRNAARVLVETGAQAVKLEGGTEMAETIAFLETRGVPVLAHIGLMPQHKNRMGGFTAQGKNAAAAQRIHDDALAVEQAGAFGIVIEGTAEPLARRITQTVRVPTIGIGASPTCDGQVLVGEDIFGMFDDYQPRFAKRYASLNLQIVEAVKQYAQDVRDGTFPSMAHCFEARKESP